MPRITRLDPISSIKVGPGSTVLPDGTIVDPVPYEAVNIRFDDAVVVQVERPLTLPKIQAAWRAATTGAVTTIDGISTGAIIAP